MVKFKNKLTAAPEKAVKAIPNYSPQQKKLINVILSQEFSDLIDQSVISYFQKNHPGGFRDPDSLDREPVRVDVDFSKLDQIRSEAAEIQGKLLVPEEAPDISDNMSETWGETETTDMSYVPDASHTPDTAHTLPTQTPSDTPDTWTHFMTSLSRHQRQALMIILAGEKAGHTIPEKLGQLASQNHTLTEVLLETINEAALESLGDTLIEAGEGLFCIYDDYKQDLMRAVQEIGETGKVGA
jgi:hypothetical protein